MVDPYAIVRRLTGHELISPKDARLLTEAVDGLIGEIGSKDARIAELEAKNERLSKLVMAQSKAIHSPEALSRTGAVKVKALEWEKCQPGVYISSSHSAKTEIGEYLAQSRAVYFRGNLIASASGLDAAKAAAQADYERRILSALTTEPAAPEGQQEPVAFMDAEGNVSVADGSPLPAMLRSLPDAPIGKPLLALYAHPPAQAGAVTEAMVEAAANSIANIWCTGDLKAIARAALKAAMEAGG